MKKVFIVIFISIISELFAQTIPFEKFDSTKIDVGTMYVYEYSSNKENFVPNAKKYFYVKSLNKIEVMTVFTKDTLELPDIFKYKLNWDYMMLEKSSFKYVGNKSEIGINFIYKSNENIDFQRKIFMSKSLGGSNDGLKEYVVKQNFESIPTYFYQYTDLMPLWFSLRFYPLDKEKITVNSLTSNYNTEVDIEYKGEEVVNVPYGKVLCRKFELIPQLSFFMKLFSSPKKVFIWLSSEAKNKFMVKYKNNNPQNTIIQSMEYRLRKIDEITIEEWEELKTKNIEQRLNAKKKENISK